MDALVSQFTHLSAEDRETVMAVIAASDAEQANRPIVEQEIAADIAMIHSKLAETRAQGVKTIELTPKMLFQAIDLCIEEIQPTERIRVTLPMSATHSLENGAIDWDFVRDISNEFHGSAMPDDVFFLLRHDSDESKPIIADIYRMPGEPDAADEPDVVQ